MSNVKKCASGKDCVIMRLDCSISEPGALPGNSQSSAPEYIKQHDHIGQRTQPSRHRPWKRNSHENLLNSVQI